MVYSTFSTGGSLAFSRLLNRLAVPPEDITRIQPWLSSGLSSQPWTSATSWDVDCQV